MPVSSSSEAQTKALGERLGRLLGNRVGQPQFIQLKGTLGAGKSTFARGFITGWLLAHGEPAPESMVSPSYNLVKVYGTVAPLAHFDLYRIDSMEALEQLGYELYFYETTACLVEWLEQIPGGEQLAPPQALLVSLEICGTEHERRIDLHAPQDAALEQETRELFFQGS